MRVALNTTRFTRENWSLSAHGVFTEGIHLVSGDVGSGKTTLALMLAGLVQPSAGTVDRNGVSSLMVSFEFPEYHVTGATVREECISWGVDPSAILEAADLSGTEERAPLGLSRGELKRLHLACVMAGRYDLLVLDEPFSSLDCREKERFCTAISGRPAGITVIFTHEQMIFPRVDCLWEIAGGALRCRGPVPEALAGWEHAPELIRQLLAAQKIPKNITPADLMEAACRT